MPPDRSPCHPAPASATLEDADRGLLVDRLTVRALPELAAGPFGNYLARVVFPGKAAELDITVGLIADMEVINPLDFFVEDYAERYPFRYPAGLADDLKPYLQPAEGTVGPLIEQWLARQPW